MVNTLTDADDRIRRLILFNVALLNTNFFGDGHDFSHVNTAIAQLFESFVWYLAFIKSGFRTSFEIFQVDLGHASIESV